MVSKCKIFYTLLFFISMPVSAGDITSAANKFWSDFRAAVSNDDYTKLAKLTRFPLAVHGEVDFIPVKKVNKNEFPVVFKKIINQEQFVEKNGEELRTTMRKIVLSTEKIDKKYNLERDKHFRVSDLVFDYKDNRWALFRTYYSEE